MENVVLIGSMGTDKTIIGQSLASKLKVPHFDSDIALIEKIGRPIPDYFEKYDEAAFREQETQLLKELSENTAVLSTGDGIIAGPKNRSSLKSFQRMIYLHATPKELLKGIMKNTENQRSLVIECSSKEIITLSEPRKNFYEECAKMTIDTINRSSEETVNEILQQLRG